MDENLYSAVTHTEVSNSDISCFGKKLDKREMDNPPLANNFDKRLKILWRLKVELMTLSAIVFRLCVLMVAKITVQIRAVVRRRMRISRFHVFCFFSKLRRTAMAGHTLLHRQSLRCFSLSMTFNAIDIRQHMMMTVRQFTGHAEIIFVVAGFASLPVHGFGVGVFIRQHVLLNMAGGAIPPLDTRLGNIQFGRGPESLTEDNSHHDAE